MPTTELGYDLILDRVLKLAIFNCLHNTDKVLTLHQSYDLNEWVWPSIDI